MTKKRGYGKPCGRCGSCEIVKFLAWIIRISDGLGSSLDESMPRFALIQKIHDDVARRHPLGIVTHLARVIESLSMGVRGGDDDARCVLGDLVRDEANSIMLNGRADHCRAGVHRLDVMRSE